jgi:putative peptide zinc metalloprotease protein
LKELAVEYINPTPIAHHSTVELANTKLLLRPDLSFHLQEFQGKPCYLIEDQLNSKFYRVGPAEYNFLSLLDGGTTISQAVAQTASSMGHLAIQESDAISICKWLIDTNLASTRISRSSNRLIESSEESSRKRALQKLNPVTPKIPLFNPDRILGILNSAIGWLFSTPVFFVWLLVIGWGGYEVYAHWTLASTHASAILARDNWIWLGLAWILLKLIHETAHGIVCKRFDGDVRQAGVVLLVLVPLPFVDVTSSWRFSSKWQRIYVATAGMYAEIFVAAIAAIVWCRCEPGMLRQQCYNIMIAGSVTTLFFNANPLMRFDGYYILTDWLELPNLGTHATQFLRWFGKKYYLGLDSVKPTWPEKRGFIVGSYAVAAFVWRILIYVALILTAESLLFGAGIVLAILAVGMWVCWPILKLVKFVFVGKETEQKPSALRFVMLTSSLCATGWAAWNYLPWHARIEAPAIVDYATISEVRTSVGGFVVAIHVQPDQFVEKGDLLATLSNPELETDIQSLRMDIQSAELRARVYMQPPRQIAAHQVEIKNGESLRKRLAERLEQQYDLEIRAQVSGQVLADDLDVLSGTYLAPGHKLCSLGSLANKKINALIAQRDFELFQNRIGNEVDVHVWGNGPGYVKAKLDQVNPRARVTLPHPAFNSASGGPLTVKYRPPSDTDEKQDPRFELVDPRFLGEVTLSDDGSQLFRAGQPATVSFRTSRGTVGEVLSENTVAWFRKMRQQKQSAWR